MRFWKEPFRKCCPKNNRVRSKRNTFINSTRKKNRKLLCLRKVTYWDEKERAYEFITAHIYKLRWGIELLGSGRASFILRFVGVVAY
ncbi:hypothetical protein BCL90_0107 [Pedobacter alluvionis]|uniref:Uncharacterized protein n=1 Tax=Pedobacter alluvionis TaxID=475253 RepID=A0A497Y788_9SPHI|nr:hypothetical protein BCL90_0107 [Pedobacter alluvionis]